jgi:hypothetical protein
LSIRAAEGELLRALGEESDLQGAVVAHSDENDITYSEHCAAHGGSGLKPEKMDMPGGPCMLVRVANYLN